MFLCYCASVFFLFYLFLIGTSYSKFYCCVTCVCQINILFKNKNTNKTQGGTLDINFSIQNVTFMNCNKNYTDAT